jgi:hypothetical protein
MKDFTISIKTRIDIDAEPVMMNLNIDNSLLSTEDMEEYAKRAIVVQLQNEWRAWMKSDKSKPDPLFGDAYKTKKPGTRTGVTVEDKLNKIAKTLKEIKAMKNMTTEELANFLDSL